MRFLYRGQRRASTHRTKQTSTWSNTCKSLKRYATALLIRAQLDDELIYSCLILQVGRLENAIGWYHSHPGYGCWLSGIDVNTQMNNQKFTDPFVAVVVRCYLSDLPSAPLMSWYRLTPTVRYLLGELTLAPFALILRDIRRPMHRHLNIRASHSTRLKTLAFTQINTTRWRCRSSSRA